MAEDEGLSLSRRSRETAIVRFCLWPCLPNICQKQRVRESSKNENVQELKKNFLVEMAEYVGGDHDFSQIFQVGKPIYLEKINLTLQKFGGRRYMVPELHEDNDCKPGTFAAENFPVDLSSIVQGRG